MGGHLLRPEFVNAPIVIAECTFFEQEHRGRATVGKHLHIDDIADLLQIWTAEHIVITHTSRRTNLDTIHKAIAERVGCGGASRIHILMDHRANRLRYEQQLVASEGVIGCGAGE
jgi:ribonuclease BN (tRNA processing enzyme)